jgi:stearoyl-CoA desaturase (delta-9 desaturase)
LKSNLLKINDVDTLNAANEMLNYTNKSISITMEKTEIEWFIKTNLFWWGGWISLIFSIGYAVVTGEWWWIASAYLAQKIVSPIANGVALHRYFAHSSFKTGPRRHKFLVWISVLAAAGSPISYATQHRHHHKHTENPEDIHSPHISMIDAMGFWAVRSQQWYYNVKKVRDYPRDLIRDPEIAFVHRHYYTIWAVIFAISFAVSWKVLFLFVWPMIGWYMFGSAVFINIFSHIKLPGSYRNFDTNDQSHNNKWIQWYTMQEGLHNNHHRYPGKYDQALVPGEFDVAGHIVKKFFDVEQTTQFAQNSR